MTQDELIALEITLNKKWEIYKSFSRLYQLGSPSITSEDVQTAEDNFYNASRAYQLARKEMGYTYIEEG